MPKEKVLKLHMNLQAVALLALLLPLASLLSACTSMASLQLPVQAMPGYRLTLFASGNASYTSPDAVDVDEYQSQKYVFLDYQNITDKYGKDHKTSTIVQYYMSSGQVYRQFSIPGHSDGMRIDHTTHKIWALANENQNPVLTIIDLQTGKQSVYCFDSLSRCLIPDSSPRDIPPPHGGGYDDLYFLDGWQYPFISASNPDQNKSHEDYPIVAAIIGLTDGINGKPGHVHVAPILRHNASAIDVATNASVTLDEVDYDSLSVDSQGHLVLISQENCDLISLDPRNPQQVKRLRVGTQIDDTVWIPSAPTVHGRLLIVDAARNQTYWIDGDFKPDTIYTESYPDSSVQSIVGQVDSMTGVITIVATGFLKPTGLLFVPDE